MMGQRKEKWSSAEDDLGRSLSSMDNENLEMKYLNLKKTFKRSLQNNEKYSIEIDKLNKKVKHLQNEKENLEENIRQQETVQSSESDVSESIQHRTEIEITDLISGKNKQISELLQEIEEVEKDNILLKEKLSQIRDELVNATRELSIMTDTLKAKDLLLEEQVESLKKMSSEIEIHKDELQLCKEEKLQIDQNLKMFSSEVDQKVDKWKILLDKKNSEIKQLKNNFTKKSLSSSSNTPDHDETNDSYVQALRVALSNTEMQLKELQKQMENCTRELNESTDIINKLKIKNEESIEKITTKDAVENELKNQLKKAHERCQVLQDEVNGVEKIASSRENDLQKIQKELKEKGHLEVSEMLKEVQNFKTKNLVQEKQIIGLVRDINKLQEICNILEIENSTLREQLGFSQNDEIIYDTALYKNKEQRQKETVDKLTIQIAKANEEKLELRIKLKNLNRKVSKLTECLESSNLPIKEEEPEFENKKDIKALSEENEALRKGLHEILNTIHDKNKSSQKEIKLDVLERLLQALDVKHISGWYHPAMRLQAELHTLEGVNRELREQLREAREQKKDIIALSNVNNEFITEDAAKEEKHGVIEAVNVKDAIFADLLNTNYENMYELKTIIFGILSKLNDCNINFEDKLEYEFELFGKKMECLHRNCKAKENFMTEKLDEYKKVIDDLLKEEQDVITPDDSIGKEKEITKLKRISHYLQMELHHMEEEIHSLKKTNENLRISHSQNTEYLSVKTIFLESKVRVLENEKVSSVGNETFFEVKKAHDEILTKYKQLLVAFQEINNQESLEMLILKQNETDLEKENFELKMKLSKPYQTPTEINEESITHAQKLAETEVKLISEKQRADHINNLYQLVKEQLRKSEEKFREFSKYGENILQKNLTLQEQVQDLENKLNLYVDSDIYKELENKLGAITKEKEALLKENWTLMAELQSKNEMSNNMSNWTDQKEQELHGLRHQVVDLMSASDEKLLIGRLHSDLAKYRQEEQDCELKTEFLKREICQWQRRYEELTKGYEQEKRDCTLKLNFAKKKNSVLEELLQKLSTQFRGSIPLISEEVFVEKVIALSKEKHESFVHLQNAKQLEKEYLIKKDALGENIQETEDKQINELQIKRQCEFKDEQISYLVERIKMQDQQLKKLEMELLSAYKNVNVSIPDTKVRKRLVCQTVSQESLSPKLLETTIKILKNVESQTNENSEIECENQLKIKTLETQLLSKENIIMQGNKVLTERDTEIIQFRGQLLEKTNKIAVLEKQLHDLGSRKQESGDSGAAGDGIGVKTNYLTQQVVALQTSLKSANENISLKDLEILKYQNLLKEDRDKHSLAAANLHQELTVLQRALLFEKQKNGTLEESSAMTRQKNVAVEKYVSQVHALERHAAELHTQQAAMQAQLRAAQQEASRWRQMAQDRLVAMEELGNRLDEQHKNELSSYKTDYQKLKELSNDQYSKKNSVIDTNTMKLTGQIDPDILKLIREKDDQIKQLHNKVKEAEQIKSTDDNASEILNNFGITDNQKGLLTKEMEALKKRYELLSNKEKNAREEIKDLKEQLGKRTNLSARSQMSEKSVKDQLQKKIRLLENDIEELNNKLSHQILLNEKHKLTATEDFEKWKKQKFWQENSEKYKIRLQENEVELSKLNQTCTGYRMLIERLEREKINLENRVKSLKSRHLSIESQQAIEQLRSENAKLTCDLATMHAKLDMRQQGAGTLGAALLQEKLEAQERKIAVLELSAKGTIEIRNEIERLQTALSNLHKSNLYLEAENLELKMDLEKHTSEAPHLQQQIQHLENYIEVLKNENTQQKIDQNQSSERLTTPDIKKIAQLERTVFILKRVVEKLQVENKRLISGKGPTSERSGSAEKLKRDHLRLKEQYTESLQRVKELENQLAVSTKKAKLCGNAHPAEARVETLRTQLEDVKGQLAQKTQLLNKVKALLHGSAAREKQLLQEISELKNQSEEKKETVSIDIPSPILEESEETSDISS